MAHIVGGLRIVHGTLKAYYELGNLFKPSADQQSAGHLALQKLLSMAPAPKIDTENGKEPEEPPFFNTVFKTPLPSGYSSKEMRTPTNNIPFVAIRNEKKKNKKAIFYIHGGGFVAGKYQNYISNLNRLAKTVKVDVFSPNYRLATSVSFAELKSDCIETLKYVKEEFGYEYSDIYLCGDSAGGGLVFYVLNYMLEHLEHFKTLPEKAVLISPYIDIGNVERDISKVNDPMLSNDALKIFQEATGCTGLITDDLEGNEKLVENTQCLITASKEELLFEDAVLGEKLLNKKGMKVKTSFADVGLHIYPVLRLYDKTYEKAFQEIERFLMEETLVSEI
eukprot:snap_masked-scaffold_19-processed-gene-0.14-mRNA-1 protein AED:1.00 eAED:1.00 QI:0/-1/0/0/-1/1/1/0/335